ncbi:MAG TPA: tRNA (N6-threonylcarbamoyladenosine(37)-N6)-methyltransferase TrmO [Candidatus Koribacter sp.]|jgi:tRNA-Thr(GGU) m(6)t(6)A37 methyltransferase TsaA
MPYELGSIGKIRSSLTDRKNAPRQRDDGAPEAWLELDPKYADALLGLKAGDEILVLTWLHEARRETLQVHPRRVANAPLTGVFATRSPDRPNPIGLHEVKVMEIAGTKIRVDAIECIDGTPIVDIKPKLC